MSSVVGYLMDVQRKTDSDQRFSVLCLLLPGK